MRIGIGDMVPVEDLAPGDRFMSPQHQEVEVVHPFGSDRPNSLYVHGLPWEVGDDGFFITLRPGTRVELTRIAR